MRIDLLWHQFIAKSQYLQSRLGYGAEIISSFRLVQGEERTYLRRGRNAGCRYRSGNRIRRWTLPGASCKIQILRLTNDTRGRDLIMYIGSRASRLQCLRGTGRRHTVQTARAAVPRATP